MTTKKSGLMDISNVSKSGTSIFINSNIASARRTVDRKDDKKDSNEFRLSGRRQQEDHFDDLTIIQQQSRRIAE